MVENLGGSIRNSHIKIVNNFLNTKLIIIPGSWFKQRVLNLQFGAIFLRPEKYLVSQIYWMHTALKIWTGQERCTYQILTEEVPSEETGFGRSFKEANL